MAATAAAAVAAQSNTEYYTCLLCCERARNAERAAAMAKANKWGVENVRVCSIADCFARARECANAHAASHANSISYFIYDMSTYARVKFFVPIIRVIFTSEKRGTNVKNGIAGGVLERVFAMA